MIKKQKSKFQTDGVIAVSFAHMLHDVYSSFLAPILPLLIEKLSISYSLAGLLTVAQRIPSLFSPFVGIVADKFSIRYFLIVAPSITAICMSLLGVAPDYITLFILLFISGISSIFFHIPASVMIKRLSFDKLGKGMSFYMLGGEVSRTLGPIIILGAVSLWGLEGSYKLIPVGLFASIVLYFKIGKIKISDEFKKSKKAISPIQEIKKTLPVFSTITAILLFRMIIKGCLTAFLPIYFLSQGESLWIGGISISVLQFAGAVVTIFAGTLSDRLGRAKIILISCILTPIFMTLFMLTKGYLSIFILIFVGFSIFATGPVFLAIVNDIKSDNPALLNGIYLTINFLVTSLTIFFVGFMIDKFGPVFTYKTAIALSIIPIFISLKLQKN